MNNRVKELRKEKGYTQEDLAEFIGVSRQTVNAIEKQKFDPSLNTAFKMAKLFELPIESIFLVRIKFVCKPHQKEHDNARPIFPHFLF